MDFTGIVFGVSFKALRIEPSGHKWEAIEFEAQVAPTRGQFIYTSETMYRPTIREKS